MPAVLARTRSGISAALVVMCFALGARAEPSAKEKAAAESLFLEATALFDQGQYEQACAKFAASQELDAGFGTLMNLGECYERRGMTASAWATFKEAAGMARSMGQTEREAAARARAASLEGGLPKLVVRLPGSMLSIQGLEVRLNGTMLPRGVWGSSVPVDPGTQHVEITAPGYEPWKTELEVARGPQQTPLEAPALVKREAPESGPAMPSSGPPSTMRQPQPPPPPAAATGDGTQRTIGFVLGGAGAVGLVIGTVFGLSAISKNKDSDDLCRTEHFCSAKGLELRNDAKDAAAASTIGFVAGGAFAAGGLALVLTATSSAEPATAIDRTPRQRKVRLTSRVGSAGVRFLMEGSF